MHCVVLPWEVSWSDHFMNVYRRNHVHSEDPASPKKRGSSKRKRRGSCSEGTEVESPRLGGIFRHPPTGQKRFVYLDPRQPKYGFRLEVGYKCVGTCTYMNELQCVNGTAWALWGPYLVYFVGLYKQQTCSYTYIFNSNCYTCIYFGRNWAGLWVHDHLTLTPWASCYVGSCTRWCGNDGIY